MADTSPRLHPACLDPERLLNECDQTFTRRSGPGGQNRNKVETAVVLKHRPTGLEAEANERRTQGENRQEALHRLRVLLALEIRTPPGQATDGSPSPLWKSRCRGGRLQINPGHDDFPPLLAEALDAIAAAEFDPKPAALQLGCSSTQLVKLIQHEPRALVWWNARRLERGLHRLH
jgi:hypothetical protein